MSRLLSLTSTIYFTMLSFAFAAEEMHGEVIEKVEEGIESAEHASKGGLPQFEPEWFASQVFWLGISFALLYFIFSKSTLPNISSVIENRKNHIDSDLETAEKLAAQADSVQETYQNGLDKAQNDAANAIKDVETKAKTKIENVMNDLRQKSDKAIKEAEKNIEDSKMAAMDDMNQIAMDVAAQAVEKIIGSKPNKTVVQSVVKDMHNITKAKAA